MSLYPNLESISENEFDDEQNYLTIVKNSSLYPDLDVILKVKDANEEKDSNLIQINIEQNVDFYEQNFICSWFFLYILNYLNKISNHFLSI
jgi:hypothetical protein